MRIVEWFRNKWQQGKALTLDELREEMKLSELRVRQLVGIAKANPYNENLWDKASEEKQRWNTLNSKIKQLEEHE